MRRALPLLVLLACASRPPATDAPAPASAADDVLAQVWYARAVLAEVRGDAAELDRSLGWVGRLAGGDPAADLARGRGWLARGELTVAEAALEAAHAARPRHAPTQEALGRLRVRQGEPTGAQLLVAAAEGGRPWLWPEALAASADPDAVLERWWAVPLTERHRGARAEALAARGRWREAALDAAADVAWVPRPEGLARWAWAAACAGDPEPPARWAVAHRAWTFGSAWAPALREVAAWAEDPVLDAAIGQEDTPPPPDCEASALR